MGKLADAISTTTEIQATLDRLYSVQGWDAIALRLMWYIERARETGAGP